MSIQSIGTFSILNNLNISNTTEEKTNGTSFSNVLSDAISKVNDSEVNANNKIESLIKGEDVEMHEVMLAMQESVLSLQALIEVRNKTVEAYQEVSCNYRSRGA